MAKQPEVKMTENGVELLPNTAFFEVTERDKAKDHIKYIGGYIMRVYNCDSDLIGWGCPA